MAKISAELIDYMGSDDRVVDAARVSFSKKAENYSPEKNERLISYLAKHDHWTPSSHCVITLRETVPIFVARERFRHVVGFTYNEESRRYIDSEPEFYVPDAWRKRAEDKKQGSGDEIIEKLYHKDVYWGKISDEYQEHVEISQELYRFMIENGVAPEQARMVLPQSMMTSYYCTGSLAAFARAYKLRSYPDAQAEIRDLAEQWDAIIRPLFPYSWAALVD